MVPGLAEGVKTAKGTPGSVPNSRLELEEFANSRPSSEIENTTAFWQLAVLPPLLSR